MATRSVAGASIEVRLGAAFESSSANQCLPQRQWVDPSDSSNLRRSTRQPGRLGCGGRLCAPLVPSVGGAACHSHARRIYQKLCRAFVKKTAMYRAF